MGAFVYGFEGMAMNGAVKAITQTFGAGKLAIGFAGSAAVLGGILGAFIGGRLSDKIGRRTTLMLVGLFFLVEGIVCPFAPNLFILAIARFAGGLGMGAATTVGPGYIAEIVPADIRGRLIATRQLEIILGLFVAGMINLGVTTAASGSSGTLWLGLLAWQWMFLFMLIPAVLYLGLSFTLPESPRFLVVNNRNADAAKVLKLVSGDTDEQIAARIASIEKSLGATHKTASFKDLFTPQFRNFLPLVWVGMAIAAFQQLTGINGIFFYSNILWESIGYTESASLKITLITTFVKVAAVVTGIALIDKVGRRRLLIWGGSLMTLSLITMCLCFTFGPSSIVDGAVHPDLVGSPLGPIALVAAMLFTFGFASTWGPIFSVVMGEMFPNTIRGSAMSLAGGTDYVANYLVVTLFPLMISFNIGFTYGLFAFFGFLSVIFVVKFLKETNGLELEEMETLVD